MRALKCKEHLNAELVPVDLCVNSILAAAWDVAKKNYDSPPVYNYVTSETNPITWKTFMTTSIQVAKSIHFTRAVWCPTLIISDSSFYVKFLQFFLHIVPGACVDLICFALGKKFRWVTINL